MNKQILFLLSLIPMSCIYGQVTPTVHVDANNVDALITSRGSIGHDFVLSNPSYEIPKGNGTHPIFEFSPVWTGELNGELKCSFQAYNISGNLGGPVSDDYNSSWHMNSRTFFSVPYADAQNHMNNWNQSGYTAPQSITDWLGNGQPSEGTDLFIAPFEDVNGDQSYTPGGGDYPVVYGDVNYFSVYNYDTIENTNNESIVNPYPIEVRQTVYQFATNNDLNNTTFIKYIVVNRGSDTLKNFKFGFFTDFELGNAQDDYLGTDSSRNLFYVYNADNLDENTGGNNGYQNAPPAFGVKVLNKELHASVLYSFLNNLYSYNTPAGLGYAMNGRYANGQIQQDGSASGNKFLFHGDPNQAGSYSEVELTNSPGDRRGIGAIAPIDLAPNEYVCYDMALVYAEGTDNLNSVAALQTAADNIQTFYDTSGHLNCWTPPAFLSIENETPTSKTATLYPNPTENHFTVGTEMDINVISIFNINGQLVKSISNYNKNQQISTEGLHAGMYFIRMETKDGHVMTEKLIKK